MKISFKPIMRIQVQKILPLLFATFAISISPAGLADSKVSYESRPDIVEVAPKQESGLDASWDKLKRGQVEAVAQLIEMYPDHQLYFLARDSELLYDIARLISINEPALAKRIHLLNVSRANMRDPHLVDYLTQEGLSEKGLKGKKALLVDTGFAGTIPRVIKSNLPDSLGNQIETQLMASSNSAHPSSRVFLSAINPMAAELEPGKLHASVVSYEYLPRYTDRSDHFEKIEGRWHAMSPNREGLGDGEISRSEALRYMQDLKKYMLSGDTQSMLDSRRALWRSLKTLANSSSPEAAAQLKEKLKKILKSPDGNGEAIVRDFIEIESVNFPEHASIPELSQVGLKPIARSSQDKNKLIKKYPQWAKYLEDPENGIETLLTQGDYGTLGSLCDVVTDDEFFIILFNDLAVLPPNEKIESFVETLLAHLPDQKKELLIEHLFGNAGPYLPKWKNLIHEMIATASDGLLHATAMKLPHEPALYDEMELLISRAKPYTLKELAQRPIAQDRLIDLLIQKGDKETLNSLAFSAFPPERILERRNLLAQLISRADPVALESLKKYTLSENRAPDPRLDVFREALEINKPAERASFLKQELGKMPQGSYSKTEEKSARAALKARLIDRLQSNDRDTRSRALKNLASNFPSDSEIIRLIAGMAEDEGSIRRFQLGEILDAMAKLEPNNAVVEKTFLRLLKQNRELLENEGQSNLMYSLLGPLKSYPTRNPKIFVELSRQLKLRPLSDPHMNDILSVLSENSDVRSIPEVRSNVRAILKKVEEAKAAKPVTDNWGKKYFDIGNSRFTAERLDRLQQELTRMVAEPASYANCINTHLKASLPHQ